jgi:hypothetical protein
MIWKWHFHLRNFSKIFFMKLMLKALSAFYLLVCSCTLYAQNNDDAMKAWTTYMTPGDVHKMLAKDDGVWEEDITLWMSPGAPPTKSTATVTNKMILGGRYQESRHVGSINGMPFEGMGLTGYDNAKKVFVSSWVDNMSTGIMNMEGVWDEKTKTATFTGISYDPMSGKDMKVRQTFKWIDDNTQMMEMFAEQNGKEVKTMEIRLTRKR